MISGEKAEILSFNLSILWVVTVVHYKSYAGNKQVRDICDVVFFWWKRPPETQREKNLLKLNNNYFSKVYTVLVLL